jgi:hypothetical protein
LSLSVFNRPAARLLADMIRTRSRRARLFAKAGERDFAALAVDDRFATHLRHDFSVREPFVNNVGPA